LGSHVPLVAQVRTRKRSASTISAGQDHDLGRQSATTRRATTCSQPRLGDVAFFYHSNAKPPGIIGLCKVVATNVVDPDQFDEDVALLRPEEQEGRSDLAHGEESGSSRSIPNLISLDELGRTRSPATT